MLSFDRDIARSDVAANSPEVMGDSATSDRASPADWCALALNLAGKAVAARQEGDESGATEFFRKAVDVAIQAMEASEETARGLAPHAARWALDAGDAATARTLLEKQSREEVAGSEVWRQIADVDAWPDAWLIATVRRSPPDEEALDVLAQRYWRVLFGRCQMLMLKREAAADLAQDTWCRVLRSREKLLPNGNFRAYLLMIATNLWRDSKRAALRAGMLASERMASLEEERAVGDGQSVSLEETVPDLSQLEGVARDRLKQDVDFALEQLDVLSRDVLIARFLDGVSCAEIGRRYGRTEQTASGWLRRALSELKVCLEASRHRAR